MFWFVKCVSLGEDYQNIAEVVPEQEDVLDTFGLEYVHTCIVVNKDM